MALFIDKLRISNILVRGDVPRAEAEEFAETIAEALEPAATESDIEARDETRMATELEPIRSKIEFTEVSTDQKFQAMLARSDQRFVEMQAQMDTRFAETQAQMRVMQAEFDARMAKMEVRIYRANGIATALIIGAMSVWAAFG